MEKYFLGGVDEDLGEDFPDEFPDDGIEILPEDETVEDESDPDEELWDPDEPFGDDY
ncbi:MAG: hypothetical protein NUV82_02420 [Candidatus Komeilibacteria bacterium]|nr:hypothetical protein [Candidatus Komeilibacteria bacterium]